MHMKRSHLLKIKSAAATLCAVVLLCGCNNELRTRGDNGDGEEGELTTATLSVGLATGEQTLVSKGLSDEQEKTIHNLYILAFQPDAGDYKLKYYATGRSGSGSDGKFTFTLRRSASGAADTKLLLIANQNPYPLINTGMTYGEVQAALTSAELAVGPAFADTGIPMFGFAGNNPETPLEITEGMALNANLLRAVARVDVGVGTYDELSGDWNKGDVDFKLTEIYVFKPQNRYTLMPLVNNLKYINGIPSVTAPSPAGEQGNDNFQYLIGSGSASSIAEIYIPEAALKDGTVYDVNHDNRMALVVGGIYNTKTYYYRIDFTTVKINTQGAALHDVLRNHIYRYSITGVSQPGYTTAAAAYSGKPVGLSFTADIADWQPGVEHKPNPDMLVRMNYGGINGMITTGRMKENGTSLEVTVSAKLQQFTTDDGKVKPMLNYNKLLGEAYENTYNGSYNGGQYRGVSDALNREGPYAQLVIAPDNATESVMWRSTSKDTPVKNRVLDAKKVCWDYRGQGKSDWRLPRLSELCLLWLNRVGINQSKGFTSLGESSVTYWTGTEGGTADKAYAINAAGEITLNVKTAKFAVRCVREVR